MEMLREQRKQLQLLEARKVNATAYSQPAALTWRQRRRWPPAGAPAAANLALPEPHPFSTPT
jgi:hypothetical protein